MRSRLANHFQRIREEMGLSLPQLAQLLGYQNVTKGCNKIQKFEDRGEIHVDLMRKLADVLGVDRTTIKTLLEEDHREFVAQWNEWANEPIQPYVVIRLMAAAYLHKDLPVEVTTKEEAEAFAAEMARQWSKKACLVWTRRVSVWFEESGNITGCMEATPGVENTPSMRLKGSRRSFVLNHPAVGGMMLRIVNWPPKPLEVNGESSDK